ncbi:SigE family RNA polymerase sigma factor [Streptomyces sp. NPDC050658]|uniref:SigE family RNA polymerase sigma factor n=1 Tax=unclassified Streptomyces TaxID=2593676 RepID=UPI0034361156
MYSGRGSGSGRDAAFSAFMGARYGSIVRTARLLTGSSVRAEDLAQEALLRTYRAWQRIGREEAAEAYTRTTMVRLLVKDRRRRWSQEIPAPWVPDVPEPGHEEQVSVRVTVREVLRTLPPAQRAVLVLRYYHQLSERETAEALGCSPGTVKSRTARALAALRTQGFLVAASDGEGRNDG